MTVVDQVHATDGVLVVKTAGDDLKIQVHDAEAHLTATATLAATAEVAPGIAPKLTLLGLDITHQVVVKFADLQPEPDSPCIIEIQTADGALLAMGGGQTPADALSAMFEQMLPPSSSEHFNIKTEEPPPDDW